MRDGGDIGPSGFQLHVDGVEDRYEFAWRLKAEALDRPLEASGDAQGGRIHHRKVVVAPGHGASVLRRSRGVSSHGGARNPFGTMGRDDRKSLAMVAGMATCRCTAVRRRLARMYWVWAPRAERLPPHTLRITTAGRIACSARQLVASTVGS